jgi:hypothetical protein
MLYSRTASIHKKQKILQISRNTNAIAKMAFAEADEMLKHTEYHKVYSSMEELFAKLSKDPACKAIIQEDMLDAYIKNELYLAHEAS